MKTNKNIVKKIAICSGACMVVTLGLGIGIGVADELTGGSLTQWADANAVEEVQDVKEEVEPVYARCESCGEYTIVCKDDCAKCDGNDDHDHELNYYKRCDDCGKYLYDSRARDWASKVR